MDAKNLLTVTGSNFHLIYKLTLFPAIIILFIIPLIYGTSNLDSAKSADCLERMAALIGVPMFVPLLKPEQNCGIAEMIHLRPFPYRMITMLRMGISLICTFIFILIFEGYMVTCGCSFPIYTYALRTLVQGMSLGFLGLLTSTVTKSTVAGYLVSFCWYFILQAESLDLIFKTVTNGIGIHQILLLTGCSTAIVFFSDRSLKRTHGIAART